MAEEYYLIPENPAYKADEIRKLKDTDPASASLTFNPVFEAIVETLAHEKNAVQQAYELANEKQSKPVKGSFTIPTTGWGSDNVTGYTKYYDVEVSGVTANDRADIIIAPGSVNAAAACGLCPVSETLAGKVRIRASQVPTAAISAEYWIEKE